MTVHEVYPYLRVHDGAAAIDWYIQVFGATLVMKLVDPRDGRIGHAEVALGGHVIMLSDEYPEADILGPRTLGRATQQLHLHVDDADALAARMVAAGAVLTRPLQDQFYGERSGVVVDPFGHEWHLGHAIEDVEPAEMQRRWNAM